MIPLLFSLRSFNKKREPSLVALHSNASATATRKARETLPDGSYLVEIIETELQPTRYGQGRYLQLTLQIVSGDHANRMIWDQLSVESSSPAVARIAEAQLAALYRAVNRLKLREHSGLIGAKAMAIVGRKIDRTTGDRVNFVRSYLAEDHSLALDGLDGMLPSKPNLEIVI